MAQNATSPSPFSNAVDEIDAIFRGASSSADIDTSRAVVSDVMGDTARQDSRTTDSFSVVDEARVGGSTNSMSPNSNANTNANNISSSSGPAQLPTPTVSPVVHAPGGQQYNVNQMPVGTMLNAQAPTFAPVGALSRSGHVMKDVRLLVFGSFPSLALSSHTVFVGPCTLVAVARLDGS